MRLDELRFSTRMAWENNLMKWTAVATLLILLSVSIYSSVKLIASALPSGYVVTHYTVYLGIDQVLPLPWLSVIILAPIALVTATFFAAFGLFREDSIASYALVILSILSTLIWSTQLYHLIKINI